MNNVRTCVHVTYRMSVHVCVCACQCACVWCSHTTFYYYFIYALCQSVISETMNLDYLRPPYVTVFLCSFLTHVDCITFQICRVDQVAKYFQELRHSEQLTNHSPDQRLEDTSLDSVPHQHMSLLQQLSNYHGLPCVASAPTLLKGCP